MYKELCDMDTFQEGFLTTNTATAKKLVESKRFALDSLRGIILAGVGISMDEIAIGFPLGALRLPIVAVLGAIAIQTFLVTAGGILVGRKISQRLGMRTSRLAGLAAGTAFVLLGSYLILERIFPNPISPEAVGSGVWP